MANIHGIEVSGVIYNLEDTTARSGVTSNTADIGDLSELTTTEKDSLVEAANEMNQAISASLLDVFSTLEVKTNKRWIDGKPIYRKCFTGTASDGTSVDLDISDLDSFVSMNGGCLTSGQFNLLSFNILNYAVKPYINSQKTKLLWAMTNISNVPYVLILEYTKTTN